MAERKGHQPRQALARAPARAKVRVPSRKAAPAETPDQVRRDRDRLNRELETAQAEIARLRAQHDEIINRIDWVIDSLNSLTDADS